MDRCTLHPQEPAIATWVITRGQSIDTMGLCDRCEQTLRLRWLEWALACVNQEAVWEAVSRPPLPVKGCEDQRDDGAS
jgi:hypothetical protein